MLVLRGLSIFGEKRTAMLLCLGGVLFAVAHYILSEASYRFALPPGAQEWELPLVALLWMASGLWFLRRIERLAYQMFFLRSASPAILYDRARHRVLATNASADELLRTHPDVLTLERFGAEEMQFSCLLDDSRSVFEVTYSPLSWGWCRYKEALITFRDVTANYFFHRDVEESSKALRLFLRNLPLPAWIQAVDGRIIASNPVSVTRLPCMFKEDQAACPSKEDLSSKKERCSYIEEGLRSWLSKSDEWKACVQEVLQTRKPKAIRVNQAPCALWRLSVFPIGLNSDQVGVVAADLTQITREQMRNQSYTQSLKDMAGRMHTLREAERADVARDIHDQLGQGLTLLRYELRSIRPHLANNEAGMQVLGALERQLADVSAAARQIALNLRPETLFNLGLTQALEQLVLNIRQKLGIRGSFECSSSMDGMPQTLQLHVYRAAQELLNNIVRHAHATRFVLGLERTLEGYILTASDNGVGIPSERLSAKRLGLLSLRERTLLYSGQVSIETRPTIEGTRISLSFMVEASTSVPPVQVVFSQSDRRVYPHANSHS